MFLKTILEGKVCFRETYQKNAFVTLRIFGNKSCFHAKRPNNDKETVQNYNTWKEKNVLLCFVVPTAKYTGARKKLYTFKR